MSTEAIAPFADFQEYYRQNGNVVMVSRERLPLGPMDRNDWNEDYMCAFRWSVIAEASKKDLIDQNRALGFDTKIDPIFRFFYRVVALD